jgi:hypothetical protein
LFEAREATTLLHYVDDGYFAIVEVGEGIESVVLEPFFHYSSFGVGAEWHCHEGAMFEEVGDLLSGDLRGKERETSSCSL